MGRAMTLYFNLFETVSLFVTAFVVNFLVLDGKSNYLEGTLLIASYIIIAYVPRPPNSSRNKNLELTERISLGAFFYPDQAGQSELGGSANATTEIAAKVAVKMLLKA
jgi:Ca2+:H+ antiporter